jgi:hypothetical protein
MAPDFTVPDVTAPTNPTLTASPVANQWSNDNTVTVSGFASAQDETNGSGVDGFSYVWDMSASTIPDAGVDAQETITTLTSAALVDGSSHYLHVRTVDVAGNAASTMHLGPFKIDTTGPSNGALGSTPAANTWSGSSTVTANGLSNASDGAGSGLDGFSYVWDTSATTVPDSTLESQETATSITSPTLVSGSSHYLHVRSFDNAGNGSTTTHLGPFKIDTNAPTTGSLTSSPTAGNWSKVATVTVNGLSGAADGTGSGVDGFSYVWDTSATTTPDATIDAQETATSLTSPSLADGNSHYLHIRTVDSVGNISGATHLGPFFIDNSAPSLGTLSGTPGTNTWSKVATVTVDGLSAASDGAGSGMDGFSYVWDTSPTSTPDATIDAQETATSLTSPSLADGSHYLHVRAIDSAGNISATTHVGPFLIDNGAPSTGTLSGVPAADTWSDSDTVTVGGFAASSDGSGSGVDGFSFVWDTSASTVPDASVDAQETITSLTSATLVEGSSHYLHVRTIDSAGNVSSTTHVGPFKLDRTDPSAPDLTSTSTTGQWINATSVEADGLASAADEAGGSGIDGFSFVWDSSASTVPDGSIDAEESETFLTSSTLTEGIHYLHVRTIDSAGNPSATAHLGPFKIDRADPTIATLTPNPSTGTWSKATTVTVNGLASASDGTGSGIDGFSYVWDTNDSTDPDSSIDVQETATSISTSSLADGSSHYLHVRTIDNAGNPSTTTHVGPFKLDRSDPTKPSLSSLTPTGSWSANTTVEATGLGSASDEVGGSGVEGFSYAWSSSASTVPDTSIEARETATSITSPTLGDGTHYLHVRTIDGAGNGSTTEHLGPFLVDGGAPTLGTLSVTPSVGSWSNASTATVGGLGSAADGSGSGVDGFSYVWNTSAATIPDSTIDAGQTVTSLTSSTLADGSYYLHIRVIDNAGNPSGTTHVGPFKIDRTDPSNPSLSSVTPEDLWSSNETVTIDGLSGAADAGSGLSGFSYEWDSTAATVPNASVDSAASAASIISPSLSDGDHYLHLRTVDAAGNVSATVHMGPFRIDRTAPGVSNPVALQAFSNKKNLALSWDAVTDVSSGLDHYGLDYIGTAYNAPATAAKTFAPATSTTSSTTAPFAATLGTSYCFRVRSLDTVGNESSGTQTCTAIPLDDSKLKRVGSWKSVAGTGIFNDKSFSSSKVVGSKLSLGGAVNAKRLAVVATKCSTCGSIRVTFNGVAIRLAGTKSTTISLRSTKTKKNSVILLNPFPKLKSGTVVIKVLTSGKPVNIEGLGISRF